MELSYVLPVRHDVEGDDAELTAYLECLGGVVELLVLDGSPPPVFDAHRRAWDEPASVHVPPHPWYAFANGKVDGVLTGLELATHDRVVIADEDVRWDEAALRRAADLLEHVDVVRPQNFFDPLPWHARWDTARSLLNRAFGADYPGTLGVRRSTLLAAGGYDGNAMFENLELLRTVRAAGGTDASPLDLYVRRLPPTTRQFWSQRARQAYDDFAQPPRLVATLALLPAMGWALARRRAAPLVAAAAVSIAVAETGRRRAGGVHVFGASCSLMAPLWLAERALCSWLAMAIRAVWGGCRYRGRTVYLAATPTRVLRRRLAAGPEGRLRHYRGVAAQSGSSDS